jgi:hypothetical protein
MYKKGEIFPAGTKVGTFTILDNKLYRHISNKGQINYRRKCQCDCGCIRFIRNAELRNRPNLKCWECYSKSRILELTIEDVAKVIETRNKYRNGNSINWELTTEQTIKLITSNCLYCNAEPSNKYTRRKGKARTMLFMGIDRVDSNIGYTEINSVPCCKTCNFMKQALPIDVFLEKIREIYENLKLQESIVSGVIAANRG